MNVQKTWWKQKLGLALLLLILFLTDIAFGSTYISIKDILFSIFSSSQHEDIVWQFRIPKALTCILAGSALATGGLMMQSIFRNPLAGPDVLGLSSGASLMVALVLLTGQSGNQLLQLLVSSPWSLVLAASLGGMLVFALIILIAQFIKDNTSLLIIGLMISAATSSIVGILQYISKAEDLQAFFIWSMGTVGNTSWTEIKVLTVIVIIGLTIAILSQKSLNTWLLGENYSKSLGVNINRSRFWIVASTGLLAGGVTAFCGPIAFVGLAVPHLVRLAVPTSNHKILLPLVMAAGACLLLFCDLLSQLPGATQVIPLNAITSLMGAPLVIWMVVRNKQVRV